MGKHKVQRFPRLPDGATLKTAPNVFLHGKLTRTGEYLIRIVNGNAPHNYQKLTSEQKKVARMIASGMSIKEACRKVSIKRETFYRWRAIHPLFRSYMNRQIMATLEDVEGRLERHVVRATQVVDEALDNEDPYFAANVAKDVLKGRGRWKTSSTSQVDSNVKGQINLEGNALVSTGGASKEMMQTLVDGIIQLAGGKPFVPKKIINAEPEESDAQKALPPGQLDEGAAAT